MGHRVSTPRHDACTRVTSLAILFAVASSVSASAASASRPSSCCGCFISPQQPSRQHDTPLLHATLNSILTSSTVPPPNSRLGRLQNRQSSSSTVPALQRREPPGTKRSQRIASGKQKAVDNHRRTDLRYAHSAHYYSEESSSNMIDDEDPLAITKYFNKQGNHTRDMQNKSASYRRGQRAKMISFLDRRFARLHLKSSKDSNSSSNNTSSNSRKDYERRKAAWAAKYTSVSTLRKSFGSNRNRLWGDFNPTTTRRLYHTLLPRALLELRGLRDGLLSNTMKETGEDGEKDGKKGKQQKTRNGTSNEDKRIEDSIDTSSVGEDNYLQQELKELAPLAYQARLAAKKYARERSQLPGRLGSMLYDGYRSWRRYGKWKSTGMTWEQVWNKYEDQVLREAMEELEDASAKEANAILSESSTFESSNDGIEGMDTSTSPKAGGEDLDDEELTARICLRILERSVVTNKSIDKLFLRRLAEEEDSDEDEETDTVVEASQHKRRQQRQRRLRRREKKIQADLYAIEKKFDDDIRELLKYSNLATKEGEERRRKRKRGAFFWQNKSTVSTNDNSSSALTDDEKSLLDNVLVEGGEEYVSNVADNEGKTRVEFDQSDKSSDAQTAVESVEKLTADMMSAKLNLEDVEGTSEDGPASPVGTSTTDNTRDATKLRKLAIHEVFALRLLATTKQRLSLLQALPQLGTTDADPSDNTEDTSENKE